VIITRSTSQTPITTSPPLMNRGYAGLLAPRSLSIHMSLEPVIN
jgi:hypothetical protein